MLNTNKYYVSENTNGLVDYKYVYHFVSERGWICEESRRCGGNEYHLKETYPVSDIDVMFGKEMEN